MDFFRSVPQTSTDIINWNEKPPNFYNLVLLGFNLSEKDIFNLRFNINNTEDILKYKYTHENRYNKPLLKIGFISRDFSENRPSGQLSYVFFSLIKEKLLQFNVEVYIYSFLNIVSFNFKKFATIRQSNNIYRLGQMIYYDKIDILIDMQGHMHNNFNNMLKLKPAPIIIHWLGYPGTMGLKCIDYHIADRIIIPETSTPYYTEKIAYLNHCYQINNPKLLVTQSKFSRNELNYPDDKFIFCHFNDNNKLNKEMWIIWMKILQSINNSVLVFLCRDEKLKGELYKIALEYNINQERLIITNRLNRINHIHRLATLNCGLDTYYCNGHTTTSDLIAAGIPVVTFPGNTYHSRVSKSILLSLDLPELIADSWDDYINKCIKLANDSEYYTHICQKIVNNREKILYNPELYIKSFINVLFNIWNNHYGTIIPDTCEKLLITQFSNHIQNKNYKWIFYKNKDSPGNNIQKIDLKYQELRDFADDFQECVAFNTNGELKSVVTDLVDIETNDEYLQDTGIWIKYYYNTDLKS